MDLRELTENIILSIVEDKDIVAVKEFPSDNEKEIILEAIISEKDMPRVIGRNGKVINSIRTLVQASSYIKDNKTVKINIESI